MSEERVTVQVRPSGTVTAIRTGPETPAAGTFVYAPGAGSSLQDPFGAWLGDALFEHAIETWRFQFPYMESGRKSPDAPALLEETWNAVLDTVRSRSAGMLIVGGRSMGGRIASRVVADGAVVDGLALVAYPLIPPGRNAVSRTEHLPRIKVPTLFCSGTRDTFATPSQLEEAAALVPGATVHILDGADHGFSVLKSSGRTREDVWREATRALVELFDRLPARV